MEYIVAEALNVIGAELCVVRVLAEELLGLLVVGDGREEIVVLVWDGELKGEVDDCEFDVSDDVIED